MQGTGTNWRENRLVREVIEYRGDITLVIDPAGVRPLIQELKPKYNVMMDLFGVDYLKWEPATPERFAVIYNLYSMQTHERIFLKAYLTEEQPEIDSIHDFYKAANWFEREAWDLFGIVFRNHPNLIRILCHNEFEGHPLRKDYPADGYQRLKASVPSKGF